VPPGAAASALVLFIVANVAFELSGTFYNAFLPVIAAPERIGRVSGYGWGTGYIGGLLCMAVALVGFVGLSDASVPWFGLSREAGENIRATNVLVAAWMAVFCLPLFLWVPDPRPPHPSPLGHIVRDSFRQLRATFHSLRRYRHAVRFLIARLFFNDGLTTIFSFGGIYAAGTFGFSFTEILYFGLALNIAAGIGGFAFGAVDDRLGGKRTVMISLVGLAAAAAFALTTTSKSGLWIAGIVIGIFSGPNQAASRSLMGRFVPRGKENEFFGFFNFSGKATSFLGPLALGIITGATHSQRLGLSVVVVFFLVGLVLLTRVDEQEGIRLARQPLPPEDPAAP
jgi:MFS transporter, UMF1 family